MKKIVLGNGEKYAIDNTYKGKPPGDVPNPYPIFVSSRRISNKLTNTLLQSKTLPEKATPGGEIVAKMVLHPSFLAKSYYPSALLKEYKLTSLGSKEIFVKPEIPVNAEQKEKAVSSSLYYISGKKTSFEKLLSDIITNTIGEEQGIDIGKIEDLNLFSSDDKIKSKIDSGYSFYEIVLHISQNENGKIHDFINYIQYLGGFIDEKKIRSVGDLLFCYVSIDSSKISDLASFIFVRAVRLSPKISFFNPSTNELSENTDKKINNKNDLIDLNLNNKKFETNIAIFDCGLKRNQVSSSYLRYFDLTTSDEDQSDISHGEFVASAVMYGTTEELLSSEHEVISIDHYKVFCEQDDSDVALVDVLDRICSVLSKKKYKIANISLGPEIPCPDDEPNLWTSTLDRIAADGSVLIVVAAGNTGAIIDDYPELARIQPPADMLNGISIGAANSRLGDWKRADYSSIGPGRRPGYVKPDAVFFGGDSSISGEKLKLLSLYNYEEKIKFGTSFAAPLVTRLAARLDNLTLGSLTPATLRALLIHNTEKTSDKIGCGWGRIKNNLDEFIYCSENTVTIIYQGTLSTSSGVRAAIPCPSSIRDIKTKIEMTATLCFYTDVDNNHPVSYSRAGIEVVFRPHSEKFSINKETGLFSSEADSRPLFNKKNILGNEQSLRRNAHKWETCYKVNDSFFTSSIYDPCLDIKYLTRDDGHPLSNKDMRNLPILQYSLVITLKSKKDIDLYDKITEEYKLLEPLSLNITPDITIN